MTRYNIVRVYFSEIGSEIVKKYVSEAEAQKHCNDPEASSSTCTNREGLNRTARYGEWFDTYREIYNAS